MSMERRLEKAVDALDQQARRFDSVEAEVRAVGQQVQQIDQKLDRMLSLLETVFVAQGEIADRLERIDERDSAEMELFLKLSKRVDCLEAAVDPSPVPGNGSTDLL